MKPSLDQGAQASGAILALFGVFDIAAKFDMSADQLAIALGAVATLAGIVRHWFESRKTKTHAAELKEAWASPAKTEDE